jgi:hypothetical protein
MSGKPEAPRVRLDERGRIIYEPDGDQLTQFVMDNSRVAIVEGPIGSGKSKGARMRLWRHACEQEKSPLDGLRHSRWGVIRNTYAELKQSVVKDWLEDFPEHLYGRFTYSKPFEHNIRVGDVALEVIFIALDSDEDISKLRSTQFTAFYFNEVQYASRAMFMEALSRTPRFPSAAHGRATWSGVIADMNSPEEEDNWIALMQGQVAFPAHWSEEEKAEYRWPEEEGWKFFLQPPALLEVLDERGAVKGYRVNPKAENSKWLQPIARGDGSYRPFYLGQAVGKSKAWIDSRLLNKITIYADGSPVFPQFRPERHVAKEILKPVHGQPVVVGLDFGRNPAAVFLQAIHGRVFVQFELQGFDVSAQTFAPMVKQEIARRFPSFKLEEFRFFGDPKGRDKGQATDTTPFEVFAAHGLKVKPAPVRQNNIGERLAAIDNLLERAPGGLEALVISQACPRLRMALTGKYVVEKKPDSSAREPKKDQWADLPDAFGYGVLGTGEGYAMTGRMAPNAGKPQVSARRGRRSLRRVA